MSSVQVRRAVGWVGIGLGAASIVTGIVLLATAGDAHAYDRPPTADEFALRDLQPMFGPIPGGAAAGITGRF